MKQPVLLALGVGLPAVAVIVLWALTGVHREWLRSQPMVPVYAVLVIASVISLIAAIVLCAKGPRTTPIVACLLVNLCGLIANGYGVSLTVKEAVGRLF